MCVKERMTTMRQNINQQRSGWRRENEDYSYKKVTAIYMLRYIGVYVYRCRRAGLCSAYKGFIYFFILQTSRPRCPSRLLPGFLLIPNSPPMQNKNKKVLRCSPPSNSPPGKGGMKGF